MFINVQSTCTNIPTNIQIFSWQLNLQPIKQQSIPQALRQACFQKILHMSLKPPDHHKLKFQKHQMTF